ncbi:MAG TPA: VTT domain-containing protein [Burkholderiales bacterium]|nr:VTT domain-containing protein [Burkholderiales bacterium]
MRVKTYLPGLVFLATLVAIGYLLDSGLVQEMLSESWIDAQVRGKGASGELLFVAVGGAATALALPRQIVSFLGGYAFGLGFGTVLALAATELGCALTFYYARLIGRPLVAKRLGARVRRIEDFLAANPFAMTLLIRLLPVGSNFATSLAAGVSRVPARPFLLGSLVGYLPQTLVFTLAGSGVEMGGSLRLASAVVFFVASSAIGVWLYRKYRHGKSLGEDVEKSI